MISAAIDQKMEVSNRYAVRTMPLNSATQSEVVNEQKALVECIDDLIRAINSGQSVQTMADNLAQKSWWGAFKGTVSGANDKDLASMVKNLGGSLETTQKVVQVMLRLQTRKDHVLRGFHSALVDKIIKIQADTKTLDVNQRTAALDIVSALMIQVEEQLRQSDAVDRHGLRLQEIDDVLINSASVEVDFRENLKALDNQCASLKNSDNFLSSDVEALQVDLKEIAAKSAADVTKVENQTHSLHSELRNLDVKFSADVKEFAVALTELRNNLDYFRQEMKSAMVDLTDRIDQQTELTSAHEVRLIQIELELARGSTWSGRLLRHSFGLLGILISITGLTILSLG